VKEATVQNQETERPAYPQHLPHTTSVKRGQLSCPKEVTRESRGHRRTLSAIESQGLRRRSLEDARLTAASIHKHYLGEC